jgi:hypothetical protein
MYLYAVICVKEPLFVFGSNLDMLITYICVILL